MKFSENWLRTWVNPPLNTSELTRKLVLWGMEVASVTEVANTPPDVCIDLDITPNRGDCLSIAGLAREIGAATQTPLHPIEIKSATCKLSEKFKVENRATEDCPHYCCRIISGINATASTPEWLQERLHRSDIKTISPVVDVTNYVMLELGQPLHAFDKEKLVDSLIIRYAHKGEKFHTLEERDLLLDEEALLIADTKGPLALAGVIGGKGSSVTPQTTAILLESAWFKPTRINQVVQKWGVHTESSHRFERGIAVNLQKEALERATQLILEICGGQAGPIHDVQSSKYAAAVPVISFRVDRVREILGIEIQPKDCKDILERLGCQITRLQPKTWQVQVPPYRSDLTLEIDLIEEIARLHGYEKIDATLPLIPCSAEVASSSLHTFQPVRQLFCARGYEEVITYSFVDPFLLQLFEGNVKPLPLANPISQDMSVMRTTLWPGLIQVLKNNQHRQHNRNRLFEIGRRFIPIGQNIPTAIEFSARRREVERAECTFEYMSTRDERQQSRKLKCEGYTKEEWVLAGVVSGSALPEQWGSKERPVDFFDVKSDLEALFALTGSKNRFKVEAGSHPALHPAQTAQVTYQNQAIGLWGLIHPSLQKKLELKQEVILFDIHLEWLFSLPCPIFKTLSKFPTVRRDIAVIVDKSLTAQDLIQTCKRTVGDRLSETVIFDVYEGKGIEAGKKSVALGLTLSDASRTLTDEEIAEIIASVVEQLTIQYHAILRDK